VLYYVHSHKPWVVSVREWILWCVNYTSEDPFRLCDNKSEFSIVDCYCIGDVKNLLKFKFHFMFLFSSGVKERTGAENVLMNIFWSFIFSLYNTGFGFILNLSMIFLTKSQYFLFCFWHVIFLKLFLEEMLILFLYSRSIIEPLN
jgi:hypothetical protein